MRPRLGTPSCLVIPALTILAVLTVVGGGCTGLPSGHFENKSLLGRSLPPIELDPEVREERVMQLALARRDYELNPGEEDQFIWLGRRTAYLGRYNEAIEIFTDGLRRHPDSYRLLRHRGHRKITIRRFDGAIADLSRAAELIRNVPDITEPDGLPNRLNRPTSTTHTNIYYHLGLAHYLRGDFASALDAYRRCLVFSKNDDMICATTYWLYLTLRRMGRDDEAAAALASISTEMEIIENISYHQLLLLYKGELTPAEVLDEDPRAWNAIDDATLGYGVGAWYLVNGNPAQAQKLFVRVVRVVRGAAWPAFGHIAAEAELADWRWRSGARVASVTTGRSGPGSSPG